jgi:hypothetical protein
MLKALEGGKKLSLKHIIDYKCPDIVSMQETMGPYAPIISDLRKMFMGWDFVGLESMGFST